MALLLTLPNEVLGAIFENLVVGSGLRRAVRLRSTCRIFDSGIRLATWTTRALEVQDGLGLCGAYVLADYLLMRTRADEINREHPMTTTIFETIACLQHLDVHSVRRDIDYFREACLAIARHHRHSINRNGKFRSKPKEVLSRSSGLCATFTNVLALASHLGILPVIEALVEDGVLDIENPFGFPIVCAAAHINPAVTRTYLDAKLKRRERYGHSSISIKPIREAANVTGYESTKHPRDISSVEYHKAIAEAVCFGTFETVKLLMHSAISDDKLERVKFWPVVHPKESQTSTPLVRKYTFVLLMALRCNRPEIVRYALDNGADPDGYAIDVLRRNTALHFAARNGSKHNFNLLLERGADILEKHGRKDDNRLIYTAVGGGSFEIVQTCLDAQVPIFSNNYLLVCAVKTRRPDILQLLISHGVTFEPDLLSADEVLDTTEKAQIEEITAIIESIQKPRLLSEQSSS